MRRHEAILSSLVCTDFSAALQAGAGPDVQVELEQTQRLIDAQIKTRELNGVEVSPTSIA